jgi:exopolysaccharide biosynthesis protein
MESDTRTTHTDRSEASVSDIASRSTRRATTMFRKAKPIAAIVAALAVAVALSGLGGYLWYLDRFVIAHVEITDVAAYESSFDVASSTSIVEDSGPTDAIGESAIAPNEPRVNESSYVTNDISIEIEQMVVGTGDDTVAYFVADVVVSDAYDLRTAFADNAFGTNIEEETSAIAERVGAVLAINGDYYGFRDTGIVIRNGVIYRDEGERTGLAIFTDGTMEVYDETQTTAAQLIASGVWNTWSFGPALLDDGEVVEGIDTVEVDRYMGKRSMQGSQPRTAVGMVDENHYVFVVVDGRSTGYSRGLTLIELAELFQDLGCMVAYNLDGGGSATMYFNGELVNNPLGEGDERGTSDILYIGA